MQDQEPQTQDWQQPAQSTAHGAYQPIQDTTQATNTVPSSQTLPSSAGPAAVSEVSPAPIPSAESPAAPEEMPTVANTPLSETQTASQPIISEASAASLSSPEYSEPAARAVAQQATESPAQESPDQPDTTDDMTADGLPDDEILIRWQALEYMQHQHEPIWYIGFGATVLILIAVAIFVFKSPTFAVLVPVMAVALALYVRRPPATIDYTVSRKGIHVNDRLYTFDQFKSFSVVRQETTNHVVLIPRKRFQLGQNIYFPTEIGEKLVDMLAARLPMKETSPDIIDKLLAKLRL
ncbi:hypothetical protein [Candidatus Southlakia epibionticum]|uniref:DUF5673 domain-containing protein n=1 Tax=Candidatus Southlakia epibionticum TaxID=3043284 RepID=A0ABY8WTB2_9BACT|nr:hypothetical protein SEML1_0089 [Candidatus Saccharimonadaceae bacterium ML1]